MSEKSLLQKLGVKPGQAVDLIGEFEDWFPAEIEAEGVVFGVADLDLVLVAIESSEELWHILDVRERIKQDWMIWCVWPNVRKEFKEEDIRNFALENGLVDVKVCRFSDRLSALKLVIPVALRHEKGK